jgi:hypothetical protein
MAYNSSGAQRTLEITGHNTQINGELIAYKINLLTFSHSRAERAACCRKFGCRPLAAAAAAGTPIQKPTFDKRDPRKIYERIKRENPSVSDIEKGNF